MRPFPLVFFLCSITLSAFAAEKPVIKTCIEDDNSFPWILKDRPGLTIFQLSMVEKQIHGKFDISPLPWKRCLKELKSGVMDAAFKISYSAARAAEFGDYPMAGDKPDETKRLLTDSYSLYRLKGSTAVKWDGKTLTATGPIGAQTGFSIVDQLKALGATVDDGGRSVINHLHKVLLSRTAAVALQTAEGDAAIANDPKFKNALEKIHPVLIKKPYFLIFSKQFHAKNPAYVDQVWKAIETARESPEYKQYAEKFK